MTRFAINQIIAATRLNAVLLSITRNNVVIFPPSKDLGIFTANTAIRTIEPITKPFAKIPSQPRRLPRARTALYQRRALGERQRHSNALLSPGH